MGMGGFGGYGKGREDQGRCDPESMIRERSPVTLDDVLWKFELMRRNFLKGTKKIVGKNWTVQVPEKKSVERLRKWFLHIWLQKCVSQQRCNGRIMLFRPSCNIWIRWFTHFHTKFQKLFSISWKTFQAIPVFGTHKKANPARAPARASRGDQCKVGFLNISIVCLILFVFKCHNTNASSRQKTLFTSQDGDWWRGATF